ncbi:MAG: ATP-binding cassette domain-containing protein [Proteobacteria bacterium]|nr:ATP-binding cassette domain-containing protein [Pseudomonadota bacterium]
MTALLEIEKVSVRFPVGRRTLQALDRVSLTVETGETLALVGESGSGKTTLGHVVAGLRDADEGTLRFDGKPLDRAARRMAQRHIQVVFQDPFGALDPRMPVSAIIAEPLRINRIGSRAEREARAAALVTQVGLPRDALNRYPHEFSGGQRQRIAIARALAPEPRLIVADEPLSALDVSIQSQVLNLMKDLQEQRRLSYLFISHDLAVVNHLADRVAVLYLGRLVEVAPRAAVFAHPAHPYTEALLAALPRFGRRRAPGEGTIKGEMPSPLSPPPGCVFHPRCPKAADLCRTTPPALAPVAGREAQMAACHFPNVAAAGA